MNAVSAVKDCPVAVAIEEAKAARHEIEKTARQDFGDVRYTLFHGDAGAEEQVLDVGRNPHARVFDELEGFFEDAFDERLVEQFEFWLHVVNFSMCHSERSVESLLLKSFPGVGVLRLRWPCASRTAISAQNDNNENHCSAPPLRMTDALTDNALNVQRHGRWLLLLH